MNNYDKEYAFFKKLSQLETIPITSEALVFAECLKAKGLRITQQNDSLVLGNKIRVLSKGDIFSGLADQTRTLVDSLQIIYETQSTNKTIYKQAVQQHYTILLSEYQSQGQGRREKKWSSPLGQNIYLSIRFTLVKNNFIHFIPLISALSVCQALDIEGIDGCLIKWPNDIYLEDKKIGGILVESRMNSHKRYDIVVGIGLNVNMQVNKDIDQHWTSLSNCANKIFDRNKIVSALLTQALGNYNQLSRFDFSLFHQDWSVRDFLKGKAIRIIEENRTYNAVVLGLANDGALHVECEQDNRSIQKKIYSAEVSVIPIAS